MPHPPPPGLPLTAHGTCLATKETSDEKTNDPAPNIAKRNGWHDTENRWKHSDFCYVVLRYVYPIFQEMISRGGLNQ